MLIIRQIEKFNFLSLNQKVPFNRTKTIKERRTSYESIE